ncbi:MAG: endonuclease MutS2 [bacterium]|nr:endonuclease MutS2 [bacterium]
MDADLKILEFDKIILKVVRFCETDLGKRQAQDILPSNKKETVEMMLFETFEAKTMIERFDSAPMNGVLDVSEALNRARLGAMCSIEELQRVSSLQSAVESNVRFIRKIRALEIMTLHTSHYFDGLISLPFIKKGIDECIDDRGYVVDSASDELGNVRRKITQLQKRISEKMDSILKSEASKLTDQIVTIRNNRLVLPVKAEYKNSFKGMIHDQSASKETVFIEPTAVMEMNNLLGSLAIQEQNEIEKILYRLTGLVATSYQEVLSNFSILTQLDILFAKAKYAIQIDGILPEISANEISIHQARHPLIDPVSVVANTITYKQYKVIIITGPNTGGKTVALKTLGICSLMAQSGLLIPAKEPSKIKIFSGIYADIGDEQSIEQSLSTFSSHITKIIDIIKRAPADALILLDELGSGTDPKEGASLAISILDYLRKRQVHVMVSTHYPELKIYAYDLEDVLNASVEFNIHTLKPTYRLLLGIPGTSNAIDIATRLGLNDEIVLHAKEVSLTFDNQTMNLIKKLEHQSLELNEEILFYNQEKAKLEQKQRELEKELVVHRQEQNKALQQINEQKTQVIQKAKEDAMLLIDELDKLKKEASFKEHELAKLKHDVKSLNETKVDYKKLNQTMIQVGDIVNVIPFQRSGIVMKNMGSGNFQIQMGTITSVFHQNSLEFSGKKEQKNDQSKVTVTRSSSAKMELDLRGQRYEEAMIALEKFVDDCLMNNLEFAYIIHGYGTGALRKGVQDFIKVTHDIKSSRAGGMSEGGSGVTVVYFK